MSKKPQPAEVIQRDIVWDRWLVERRARDNIVAVDAFATLDEAMAAAESCAHDGCPHRIIDTMPRKGKR